MKSNFHNFNRKKTQCFISEIEMHCMFTNERKKKLTRCMHNLKKSIHMDFSDNQRCSMNTLLFKLEGIATTVFKDTHVFMETTWFLSQKDHSLATTEFIN